VPETLGVECGGAHDANASRWEQDADTCALIPCIILDVARKHEQDLGRVTLPPPAKGWGVSLPARRLQPASAGVRGG
jgi:hypothetical protein